MVVQLNLKTDTICFPFHTVKKTMVLKSHGLFSQHHVVKELSMGLVTMVAMKMVSLDVIQRFAVVNSASDFAMCAEKILKKIKVIYSAESEIPHNIVKMLDARWHQSTISAKHSISASFCSY